MDWLKVLVSVIAAIGLFTHSLESFSEKFLIYVGGGLKSAIGNLSQNKLKGLFFGFIATALVQSSSAVVAIVISIVDSGVITFSNSLPILLGSNIGTTITAWLVSLKIEALGISLIALGFILGHFKGRLAMFSKPVFYLGLILFSLDLISENLEPIKDSPAMEFMLSYATTPIIGILIGALVTAICQSSSVTIGLAIILCDSGVLGLSGAIAIVVGSNIGTTSTAYIAAIKLKQAAKRTAFANLIFNAIGVIIYLPLASLFVILVQNLTNVLAYQVAYAHLFFNILIAIILIPFTNKIAILLERKTLSSIESKDSTINNKK
ncbi:Na/Pi cotransporter family protein [Maribacter sp. 1_MG-2023]|uniref:Na/Pi cotransporter family protein n=1 Tax=Maribacter sp. 1_MG-2023 TaxID=3062677 RepID=UPI0026E27E96|nr:Na/Pi symporter [Maribacter sp. 1_MG-2023]MDO6473744.1 Na/Pi symporter [Maribacter sp. 1_MG-2023]